MVFSLNSYINGAKILPHKEIKESVPEPAVIL